MVFNSLGFPLFFSIVAVGMLSLPKGNWRKIALLLASWYFYSLWNWWFAGLLVTTAFIHWLAGRINKRWSVWGGVVASIGILATFKYLGLWIDSIVMPVGISFYTFQAISYTIDVYKGKIVAKKSFIDVALYVSFFPQLLSGPIVRAADFFPQLEACVASSGVVTSSALAIGFGQFTFGFFKKVFIADRMTVFVGQVFDNCNLFDGWTLWCAAIAYTIQIYCDFSGYSDMAIGVARALGFEYKKNFDHPYVSTSVTEFWRRWHISLSTWLRDYIYIPLGGNRRGTARQYYNQMVTMLIGGVWHGADWTFVAWGGLHGLALCVHKWWSKTRMFAIVSRLHLYPVFAWSLTMLTIVVGWVIFRANDFIQARTFICGMFDPSHFTAGTIFNLHLLSWMHPHVFAAMIILVVGSISIKGKSISDFHDVRKPLDLFIVLTLFLLAIVYPFNGASPFIYFKF